MGQKVSPVGMRVGVNRNWNSRWFASDKEYASNLLEDIAIRKYLEGELKDAMLSHIDIERRKLDRGHNIVISIYVARPGVVIGQDGANINRIKKQIERKFKGNQIRLDVIEVKPVQKKAIQRVRRAGAKGCRTLISGRLGGADIARSEGYKEGIIPLHTIRSDIDYAVAEAMTIYGKLGVKVWICRGDYADEEQEKEEKGE